MTKVELTEKIFGAIVWVIIIAFFLYLLIHPSFAINSYDDVCKYNYGRNYIYENDWDFGAYCIELNYDELTKENSRPFNWTRKEIKHMCNFPEFWEVTNWDSGVCDGRYKG